MSDVAIHNPANGSRVTLKDVYDVVDKHAKEDKAEHKEIRTSIKDIVDGEEGFVSREFCDERHRYIDVRGIWRAQIITGIGVVVINGVMVALAVKFFVNSG